MIRSVFLRALPLMATALLSSCYENINLDHLRPTPEVVLNCVLSPDEPVRAEVMHTLFLTDEKKNTLPRITDARVQAVVNDSQVFPMVRDTVKGYFEANYVPRPGDRIRIEADTRYGRAVGEDRLPAVGADRYGEGDFAGVGHLEGCGRCQRRQGVPLPNHLSRSSRRAQLLFCARDGRCGLLGSARLFAG